MNAIKFVLVVLMVFLSVSVSSQDVWSGMPTLDMRSTSVMSVSGSKLPSAALGGVSMATMPEASMGETPLIRKAVRRTEGGGFGSGDSDWEDEDFSDHGDEPFNDPIGDTPWLLLLLLCVGYAAFLARRRREA